MVILRSLLTTRALASTAALAVGVGAPAAIVVKQADGTSNRPRASWTDASWTDATWSDKARKNRLRGAMPGARGKDSRLSARSVALDPANPVQPPPPPTQAVAVNTVAGPVGMSGPTGPTGPIGIQGLTGPAGPMGPAGPEGPNGPAGANGAIGPAGAAGNQGTAGLAGADGPAGPQGPEGLAGPTGPQGPAGAQGSAGGQGAAGAQGSAGAQGPAGPQGAAGPQGPAGAQGPAGPQGAAGPAGPAGAASATEVFRNGDQNLPQNVNQVVATMAAIPAGAYMLTAKTTLVSDTGFAEATVICTLDAGGTIDTSEFRLVQLSTAARGIVQMQLVKTFAAPGTAIVRCNSDASFSVTARHTTIIAVQVDTVTRTAVTG
jgi:Collagen triple helix repeat (20 copies)